MEARVAVIYYSATGNVHRLAGAVAEGAEAAGAEVRLRHVEELASELMISQNQYWGRHRSQVADATVATLDDLDGLTASPSAARPFGNVAAQLKQFMDQAGRLWQEGKLAGQGRDRLHLLADDPWRPESTILALNNTLYHWGMLILPLGYTVQEVFAAGGNPYGTSVTAHTRSPAPTSGARSCPLPGQRRARTRHAR